MNSIFDEVDSLALEKSKLSMSGKFSRAFLEKSPVITEKLFPYIEKSLDCETFNSNVMQLYSKNLESKKQRILCKIKEESSNPNTKAFYSPQLTLVSEKLTIKTLGDLIKHLENEVIEYPAILEIFNNEYKYIHGSKDINYIHDNYVNYSIGDILYNDYSFKKGKRDFLNNKYSSKILSEYVKKGIDLKKEDSQFLKYNLLSLKNNIHINNDKDSQTIVDSRIDKYFWIDIPRRLLFSIEELIEKKFISNISFRINYISEYIPARKAMEFGSSLKLEISELPELSKFYTEENYENNLWVRHEAEKGQLTFEELLEDFDVVNNNIVTQVVHLEYYKDDNEYFINHLDHEFIVYTIDEYQKRQTNSKIKGHKKIKTFKIDESVIPFMYKKDKEFFLLQVLDSYLKNTSLIEEYFAKI